MMWDDREYSQRFSPLTHYSKVLEYPNEVRILMHDPYNDDDLGMWYLAKMRTL